NIKLGFAFKSQGANFSFSYKTPAAAPIMAALSVQRYSGGINNGILLFSKRASKDSRNPLFAATPPATITCFTLYSVAALYVFSVYTFNIISWKPSSISSVINFSFFFFLIVKIINNDEFKPIKIKL